MAFSIWPPLAHSLRIGFVESLLKHSHAVMPELKVGELPLFHW
jgi:hypothetical protein